MNSISPEFRSKNERDQEVDIDHHYHSLGIAAVAAASQPCCRSHGETAVEHDREFESGDLD
ncbi:hypothetical protein [Consotaella aegiceratis]|uniref:hypothetical protein n=1 Tax=Consotaella aegiceratis TaxID=3097961 RepID=UPI002F4052DC